MKPEEIEKLANLSKIDITDGEKKRFAQEIEEILAYVKVVEKVSGGKLKKEAGNLRNVMREDESPHEVGMYTKSLLENALETKNGYIKVKRILGKD